MMTNREIDALIAVHVMEEITGPIVEIVGGKAVNAVGHSIILSHYSDDINFAWQVVEAMRKRHLWAQLRTPFGPENDGYWCGFTPLFTTGWNGTPDHWTMAESMPLAICLSALQAVEAESQPVSQDTPAE